MMLATSIATRQKAEASPEGPTVVDTSESVRYKVFIQKFPCLVEAVRPVVVKFAVNALSKSLISEYNKCQAENQFVQEYDRASVLMSQILLKVKDSDAHFHAFVAILQELKITSLAQGLKRAVGPTIKLPITSSRTRGESDSGSALEAESVGACSGFQCPCGHCSLEKYFQDRSKCTGLQKTPFPYLDLGHISKDEKVKLTHQLVRDADKIIRQFQIFSDIVFKTLKRNKTPVDEIVSTIFSSAGEGLPRQIQDNHSDRLEAITAISGIKTFLIRHKYISFINYRILEKLVNEHCKECRTDLDDYLQKFNKFCKRNVFEVPKSVLNSSCTLDQLLVVKVIDQMWFGAERDTHDCPFTMNDIVATQNKVAEIIGLDCAYVHLLDVGRGCIQLSFAILPCHEEAPIFPLTTSQLSELIRCGIIVLYQPNVQVPTNVQAIDCQNQVQFTDSKTPSSIKTPPIPSTIKLTSSVTRILRSQFTDDDRSMISGDSGYSGSMASSSASSSAALQESGMVKKRYMHEGFPLTMEEIERRIAATKREIERLKTTKAHNQQLQNKDEEVVRDLQLRLARITDPDDRRELEREIHAGVLNINKCRSAMQVCEEWINREESDLVMLTKTKDKEFNQSNFNHRLISMALINLLDWHKLGLMLGLEKTKLDQIRVDFVQYGSKYQRDEMVHLWLRSDEDASWEKLCTSLEHLDQKTIADQIRSEQVGPMTSPSYQPVSVAAVKPSVPSSEFNQSNFNHRLVSMALINLLDWHKLGLILGLDKIKLDQIRVDFDKYGIKRQRDEMIGLWIHSDGDASWEKLCTALEMDHNTIADRIRSWLRYSLQESESLV